MKIRRYEIKEYENELGDVYYMVDAVYGWLGWSRYTIGNEKHRDAYFNNKVPEPFISADINYLYIFRRLKDAYNAIEEDKHERASKNFKKRNVIEVEDGDA